MYRDGNLVKTVTGGTTNDFGWGDTTAPIFGAASTSHDTGQLSASLADPLIYNRVLSPSEIQQLADPSNVMLSGLILPPKRRLWAVTGGGGGPPAGKSRFSPLSGCLGGPLSGVA